MMPSLPLTKSAAYGDVEQEAIAALGNFREHAAPAVQLLNRILRGRAADESLCTTPRCAWGEANEAAEAPGKIVPASARACSTSSRGLVPCPEDGVSATFTAETG